MKENGYKSSIAILKKFRKNARDIVSNYLIKYYDYKCCNTNSISQNSEYWYQKF
jgi:hypothetical protein